MNGNVEINQDQFFADILAAIHYDKPQKKRDLSLVERLNLIIKRGVAFDVGKDGFEIDLPELLTESEKKILLVEKKSILCTLQQGFLKKHLFDHSESMLTQFILEVEKKQKVFADGKIEDEENIYFKAVSEVTKKWFGHYLNDNWRSNLCREK